MSSASSSLSDHVPMNPVQIRLPCVRLARICAPFTSLVSSSSMASLRPVRRARAPATVRILPPSRRGSPRLNPHILPVWLQGHLICDWTTCELLRDCNSRKFNAVWLKYKADSPQ
ncbi:hypothetical protein SETIT_4G183200v2 [Setaria italica]|uniref:Uncharacterized protein n=1 Tax=Setaria italica TaxID=4555 RepID=K3Y050_SETIT|nr:hypothetical protein SETIT_4G183200v2 [Setaria italica]